MSEFVDKIKNDFKSGDNSLRIIYITVGVFVSVLLINFFLKLFKIDSINLLDYFALHADGFEFLTKPWTWVTYSLFHAGFGHILFNMILLYFSGQIFTQYLSQQQLLSVYLMGVIAGGFLFVFSINVFPFFENPPAYYRLVGASAGVMAVLIAISTYVPNYTVNLLLLGRVKIWYLAIFFLILDLFNFQNGMNQGGQMAHIGGALLGFLFVKQLRKGNDISVPMTKLINTITSIFKRNKSPFKKVYKNDIPKNDYEYNKQKKEHEEIIDEILGKISKSGYDSLSKKEKEILFNSGKK